MKEEVLLAVKHWVENLKTGGLFGTESAKAELVELSEDREFIYFKVRVPKREEKKF